MTPAVYYCYPDLRDIREVVREVFHVQFGHVNRSNKWDAIAFYTPQLHSPFRGRYALEIFDFFLDFASGQNKLMLSPVQTKIGGTPILRSNDTPAA